MCAEHRDADPDPRRFDRSIYSALLVFCLAFAAHVYTHRETDIRTDAARVDGTASSQRATTAFGGCRLRCAAGSFDEDD